MAKSPGYKEMTLKDPQSGHVFKKSEEQSEALGLEYASRWWKLGDEQIPLALSTLVRHIYQDQVDIRVQRKISAQLYSNQNPSGYSGASITPRTIVHPSLNGMVTFNIIAIVIDTILSKITKSRVQPEFLTTNGNWRQKRRAQKLTQFGRGIFAECKVSDVATSVVRDAMVMNIGAAHVYADPTTQRIMVERVLPLELFVDEREALYGRTRQMHRIKYVDRHVLAECFPDKTDVIMAAKGELELESQTGTAAGMLADVVTTVESWHLRSGPDAADGRHCITIGTEQGVLLDERWDKDRFPFALFRWKPRMYGWTGESLAEQLLGTQVELNRLLFVFTQAMKAMGGWKVWLPNGCKTPPQHISNRTGGIYQGGDVAPQYLAPPVIAQQFFDHYERLKRQGFEIARLSMLSATGVKPAGLNSGEAQRVYHDIEGEGFQTVGRAFEQWHLDVAELCIDAVRDIMLDKRAAGEEESYPVRATVPSRTLPGRKFLQSINWKDVEMSGDDYELQCFPVSALPNEPSGRIQTITELAQAKYIDQQTAIKLLDFPDLQQAETELNAMDNWIEKVMDGIVEDGKWVGLDPLMDPAMARKAARTEYAMGMADGLEQEKLDMLSDFIRECDRRMAPPPLPPAPAGGPVPPLSATPLAAPMAAPGPVPMPG